MPIVRDRGVFCLGLLRESYSGDSKRELGVDMVEGWLCDALLHGYVGCGQQEDIWKSVAILKVAFNGEQRPITKAREHSNSACSLVVKLLEPGKNVQKTGLKLEFLISFLSSP